MRTGQKAGPLLSQLGSIADVRSIAGSICQSIKGIRAHRRRRRRGEHGVLVHYLALTFSTLLSSQASGAHRAGVSIPTWGNSTYSMRLFKPSQTDSNFLPARIAGPRF